MEVVIRRKSFRLPLNGHSRKDPMQTMIIFLAFLYSLKVHISMVSIQIVKDDIMGLQGQGSSAQSFVVTVANTNAMESSH